jgi:UDP-3-O-[3-hydroxymyristoyl] glucosamine N-acyltransferase
MSEQSSSSPLRSERVWHLSELAAEVGAVLRGNPETEISGAAPLDSAQAGDISFLSNPKYAVYLETTQASALIVPEQALALWHNPRHIPLLVADNPYAMYAKVAGVLYAETIPAGRIHPSAVVAASATVAPDAVIGANVVIGERAVIGNRVRIDATCVIGDDVHIDDHAHLYPRVVIYPRCVIGKRVILHSGCVIGADGFGFAYDAGHWIKIPQIGRVIIEDDAEVGANTTIDRGALGDTRIEKDVNIDNLVQIGHNCVIGEHSAVVGCAGIAGSVTIGKNCRIGGAAMIGGHLSIADGTTVAAASPVFSSIDEPGIYSGVYPIQPHRHWQRNAVQLRQLDALYKRVRALEKNVDTDAPANDDSDNANE